MKSKNLSVFTSFFLIALSLLISSLVVSALVWICEQSHYERLLVSAWWLQSAIGALASILLWCAIFIRSIFPNLLIQRLSCMNLPKDCAAIYAIELAIFSAAMGILVRICGLSDEGLIISSWWQNFAVFLVSVLATLALVMLGTGITYSYFKNQFTRNYSSIRILAIVIALIVLIICAIDLYYERLNLSQLHLALVLSIIAVPLMVIVRIFSRYYNSHQKTDYPKKIVSVTLIAYWQSVILFFLPLVDVFVRRFDVLPWAMTALSILFIVAFFISESFLLLAGSYSTDFTPLRIILYRRFVVLGDQIRLAEQGWRSIAVCLFDVVFAAWLLQSLSRFLWDAAKSGSPFSASFSENLVSPADPSNGTLFNSFSAAYQNASLPLDYTGAHYGMDILSSIFSMLSNHWVELAALWFILRAAGHLCSISNRLVIVNALESEKKQEEKGKDNAEKGDSKKPEIAGQNLADLLATKLDRIKEIYQSIDERRPIQSACAVGEPIDAAIKVEQMDDVTLSSTSEFKLGPVGIPASSIFALISHILRGPKITIGLYQREQEGEGGNADSEKSRRNEKERSNRVLIASLSGKMGSRRWIVECDDSLEEDMNINGRSIEDMATEMAHRIHASYADMKSEKPGRSVPWRAQWNFNEGLRAYRDSIKTKRKHKYFLSRAEKKFKDALKEDSNFGLAHYNLGVVYAELDQLDSAEACFKKAIDVNSDSWEAYYALGIAVFRQLKALEQSYEILGVCIPPEERTRIKDGYRNVIELCRRVLDIKSRNESFLEKDFTDKARAYDLMGNARARLACASCENRVNGLGCVYFNGKFPLNLSNLSESAKEYLKRYIKEKFSIDAPNEKISEIYNKIGLGNGENCIWDIHDKGGAGLNIDNFIRESLSIKQNGNDKKICPTRCAEELEKAKEGLEMAVQYSWMALIKESVLHESSIDETMIVSECTVDLAHVYLKLIKCDISGSERLKSDAKSALMQAIHIKPYDVNLYIQLAKIGELIESKNFAQDIYKKSLRIKPESDRILAHLSRIKAQKIIAPIEWLKICEKSECCDEKTYEGVYHFLAGAIREEDGRPEGVISFIREKLIADLSRVAEQKSRAILPIQSKENDWVKSRYSKQEYLRVCLTLCRLSQYLPICSGCETSLNLSNLREVIKESESYDILCGKASEILKYPKKPLQCAEDLLVVGLIFLELAKIRAFYYSNKIEEGIKINFGSSGLCESISCDFSNLDFREQSMAFLIISISCILFLDEILNNNKVMKDSSGPAIFLKNDKCYYRIEVGKAFLELGKLCKSLDINDCSRQMLDAKLKGCEGKLFSSLNVDDFRCNERAKKAFERSIEDLKDDDENARRSKIRMHLARAYLAMNKLPNALKEAQKAKDLNPLGYEERKVLGDIFCELEEFKYGLSELNAAVSYKPDDPEILLCLGRAYFSAGKDCKKKGDERDRILKNAKDRLEEALEIIDKPEVRYRGKIRYWIGRTLLEMGRYQEAIPHLRILADKDKHDYLPALYLGYAFMKCNSHEDSESCLFRLIRDSKQLIKDSKHKFTFLFCWERISSNDCRELKDFLSKFCIDLDMNPIIERDGDKITIKKSAKHDEIKLWLDRGKMNVKCEYGSNKTACFEAKNENSEIRVYEKVDGASGDGAKGDGFFGRQYEDERHITEILARAYIYLAYSFAERDANLCDAWRLAFACQEFVNNLKEKLELEKERARDGVLPGRSDISCMEEVQNLPSFCSGEVYCLTYLAGSPRIDPLRADRLSVGHCIRGMEDYRISIKFDPKDGLRKRKSKAHLAECAGTICYKLGELDKAKDYLLASIALYPDAGAYLNLAKAYERRLLCEENEKSEKALIERKIRDLCRHVEALDLKDEYKTDLEYFMKRWPDEGEKPAGENGQSKSGGNDGAESRKKDGK